MIDDLLADIRRQLDDKKGGKAVGKLETAERWLVWLLDHVDFPNRPSVFFERAHSRAGCDPDRFHHRAKRELGQLAVDPEIFQQPTRRS